MDTKQELQDKIRLKQLEINQADDSASRSKLMGDLAVLQAKLNLVNVKTRYK